MNTAATTTAASSTKTSDFARALLWGGCGVGILDGAAACIQVWLGNGTPPDRLFQGVASALLGRAALDGGATTTALGVLMHFAVAFAATALACLVYRRSPARHKMPVILLGALFGAAVFCAMNFMMLPLLSVVRGFYLHTPPRWPGSMGWAQFAIHLVCVGQPIAVAARRFLR
jgi:hypothetical protein